MNKRSFLSITLLLYSVASLVLLSGCADKSKTITNSPEDRKSFRADPARMPASVRQANEAAAARAAANAGKPTKP